MAMKFAVISLFFFVSVECRAQDSSGSSTNTETSPSDSSSSTDVMYCDTFVYNLDYCIGPCDIQNYKKCSCDRKPNCIDSSMTGSSSNTETSPSDSSTIIDIYTCDTFFFFPNYCTGPCDIRNYDSCACDRIPNCVVVDSLSDSSSSRFYVDYSGTSSSSTDCNGFANFPNNCEGRCAYKDYKTCTCYYRAPYCGPGQRYSSDFCGCEFDSSYSSSSIASSSCDFSNYPNNCEGSCAYRDYSSCTCYTRGPYCPPGYKFSENYCSCEIDPSSSSPPSSTSPSSSGSCNFDSYPNKCEGPCAYQDSYTCECYSRGPVCTEGLKPTSDFCDCEVDPSYSPTFASSSNCSHSSM